MRNINDIMWINSNGMVFDIRAPSILPGPGQLCIYKDPVHNEIRFVYNDAGTMRMQVMMSW